MKANVIVVCVCACVSFLPPIIQCAPDPMIISALEILNERANNGKDIKNVFRPLPNGYLGIGSYSFTYKALLLSCNRTVAIKFTFKSNRAEVLKEYRIYTYLYAIDKECVEQCGIPAVYHVGRWCYFYYMAMSLLDSGARSKMGILNELDGLIMFREFVKASKYIHGCGVRHDDIKPDNLMFRRNQLFIIDYNMAEQLNVFNPGGTLYFLPLNAHFYQPRMPKDDWESFFYSMCYMFGVTLSWFNYDKSMGENQVVFTIKGKQDTETIQQKIDEIKGDGLRRVFQKFSKHVLGDDLEPIPPYDTVYEMIDREINLLTQNQIAFLSFINDDDWPKAMIESTMIFNISLIPDPPQSHLMNYPNVDYNYFGEVFRRPRRNTDQTGDLSDSGAGSSHGES